MSRIKVFLTRNDKGYLVKASKKNGPLNSFNFVLIGLCVSERPKVEFGLWRQHKKMWAS